MISIDGWASCRFYKLHLPTDTHIQANWWKQTATFPLYPRFHSCRYASFSTPIPHTPNFSTGRFRWTITTVYALAIVLAVKSYDATRGSEAHRRLKFWRFLRSDMDMNVRSCRGAYYATPAVPSTRFAVMHMLLYQDHMWYHEISTIRGSKPSLKFRCSANYNSSRIMEVEKQSLSLARTHAADGLSFPSGGYVSHRGKTQGPTKRPNILEIQIRWELHVILIHSSFVCKNRFELFFET